MADPLQPEPAIGHLPELVSHLPQPGRDRFDRLFEVVVGDARLVPPPDMEPWLARQFGSVERVTTQRVVRVVNRWTWESALFNPIRAERPLDQRQSDNLDQQVAASIGDAFCSPATGTPADVFGRIRGAASVTAANVAKIDVWHAVVIFDEHDPRRFTAASVADAFATAMRWARRVHQEDAQARHFLLLWNCLWRAGASIVHGHAQAFAGRGSHYAGVERWRAAARRYGRSYFDDLYAAHAALGLGFEWRGVKTLAHLTPMRAEETLLFSAHYDETLASAAYHVLTALQPISFNLAVYHPPFGRPAWRNFPVIVRIVDRGDPANRTNDVGAMELFAGSVISSDPFETARRLRPAFS